MTPRFAFVPALAALVLASCSCNEGGTGSGGQGGAAGGVTSSSASGGTASGSSSATTTGGSGGSGAGEPSEWVEVPWSHPCSAKIYHSTKLGSDVPVQSWIACESGNAPGCETWEVHWTPPFNPPISVFSVSSSAPGSYELGVYAAWEGDESRAARYLSDGSADIAWKAAFGCPMLAPHVAPSGVWFGAQGAFTPSSYVFYPRGSEPSTEAVGTTIDSQRQAGSSSLFLFQLFGGGAIYIWDHQSQQLFGYGSGANNSTGVPVGDAAVLFRHYPTGPAPEGWIWQRTTGQFTPLHQPAGKSVVDFRGDSTQLVWIETDPPAPNAPMWPPGNLYTSPFATTAAGVSPSLIRPVPSFGNSSAMSDGHYAFYSSADKDVHVYRLSDGRHWSFKPKWDLREVVFVDSSYVFYNTIAGAFRQSIAALGPGD